MFVVTPELIREKTTHYCNSCEGEKSVTDFYLRPDGYPTKKLCKQCIRERQKATRSERGLMRRPNGAGRDPEAIETRRVEGLKRVKAWSAANPERTAEARREGAKRFAKENPAHVNAYNSARRARSRLATLPGTAFNERWIKAIYATARGLGLQVDHVIPLNGVNVSGLHTPLNLQILSKSRNSAKSNTFAVAA